MEATASAAVAVAAAARAQDFRLTWSSAAAALLRALLRDAERLDAEAPPPA